MSDVSADIITFSTLRATREGAETPVEIPADGILVLTVGQGAAVTIGAGDVYGIRYENQDGTQVVPEDVSIADIKFLRAGPGLTTTLKYNAALDALGNANPVTQRIYTNAAADLLLADVNSQATANFTYIAAISDYAWYAFDKDQYTPANPTDWVSPPDFQRTAIDLIAADLAILKGGPIG